MAVTTRHTDFLAKERLRDPSLFKPAETTAPIGEEYTSGQAFDFTVSCGNCGDSVCSFNVQIYGSETDFSANSDHSIAEPFMGRDWDGNYRTSHRPGTGRSKELVVDRSEPGSFTLREEGQGNTWQLECPGVRKRTCTMRQKIGYELLDRAVIRAFRSGKHELILGVDFTRTASRDRFVGSELSEHAGVGSTRTRRALRTATRR